MNSHNQPDTDEPKFAVRVILRRGLTPAQEAAFDRRTIDGLNAHELHISGGQTSFMVSAAHELSSTDQVLVLLALLDDPAVRRVCISPIATEQVHGFGPRMPHLDVDGADPLIHAARSLYEAGRIDADGLVHALGGYIIRPANPAVACE